MVWMELEEIMATGTIGEGISVCAVQQHVWVDQVDGGAIGRTCGTCIWKGVGLTSEAKGKLGLAGYR
jgi:hypothetical protein